MDEGQNRGIGRIGGQMNVERVGAVADILDGGCLGCGGKSKGGCGGHGGCGQRLNRLAAGQEAGSCVIGFLVGHRVHMICCRWLPFINGKSTIAPLV